MEQEAQRGPLAGVGVVVTRPARQAAAFAHKLGVLGARAIVFPAIVILPPADRGPLDAAHRDLAHYAAAIFVSANAAEYGVPQTPWPAAVAAFATGPGTAAALTDLHVPGVAFPRESHDSEGLLALPGLCDVAGRRIAIFRGDGGRDLLGNALRERGASVDYVTCYRRAVPTAGIEGLREVLKKGEAHALTLTSSAAAENFMAVLDPPSRAVVAGLPTFATHPRIAATARALGLRPTDAPTGDAGLIGALLQWFAAHPLSASAA